MIDERERERERDEDERWEKDEREHKSQNSQSQWLHCIFGENRQKMFDRFSLSRTGQLSSISKSSSFHRKNRDSSFHYLFLSFFQISHFLSSSFSLSLSDSKLEFLNFHLSLHFFQHENITYWKGTMPFRSNFFLLLSSPSFFSFYLLLLLSSSSSSWLCHS